MNKDIRKTINRNREMLEASKKTLKDIYKIMFLSSENVLCEFNDGFKITQLTYGDIKHKIEYTAAALYNTVGDTHGYIALEMENSPDWIVAFWAILMSGNKPYLVNMRYPSSLNEGILNTLKIEYILSNNPTALSKKNILLSELNNEGELPDDIFEDEIAFSSSATSMNETICFYSGYQISEQILNFKSIIKLEPRMAKHYKGKLKQLAFLPFYHVFGLFAVYFWFTFFGRTLVFLRDYSSDTILNTCKRHKVTHIFAVPALWHTVEKQIIRQAKSKGEKKFNKLQKGLKLSTFIQNLFPFVGNEIAKSIMSEVTNKVFGKSIMFCINGGSYLRDSALYLLNGIGYSMHNGYGSSEIGITSVELRRRAKHRNLNSIGMPFDSVEYKIDKNGTLLVKGSSLCTKKLVNGKVAEFNEWFNTGDNIEYKNGGYYIHGRVNDLVIGENGENINPDIVEKNFNLTSAKSLSVLGLQGENGEELSIVICINRYTTQITLNSLIDEVYRINEALPSVMAIKKFYFTFDELSPPTAIKVSRTQLKAKIASKQVTLIPFGEIKACDCRERNSVIMDKVCEIIADVLDIECDKITASSHIFFDLGGSSIQYFTIISKLADEFEITSYDTNETFYYTVSEICDFIERYF